MNIYEKLSLRYERPMPKKEEVQSYELNDMSLEDIDKIRTPLNYLYKISIEENNKYSKRYKATPIKFNPNLIMTMLRMGTVLILTIQPNTIIGFVFINPKYTKDGKKYAKLYDLIIHPKYRGQGYGTLFMNEIVKKAKKQGITFLDLDVWDNNLKAKSMYAKHNFQTRMNSMRKYIG